MTRAVGNGLIKTLADAIGTGAVGKLAKQVAGLSTDMANIKTPDKGSGLMFNPETGKLYIPCGNGVTVHESTGMLEVTIGDNLRYTGSGIDVPDADETTAGVVKLTHEVSNRDDGEWAITADGVFSYCPAKNMAAEMPASGDYLTSTAFYKNGSGCVSLTKNGQVCVTGTIIFSTVVEENVNINTLAFNNALGVDIPCFGVWGAVDSNPTINQCITTIKANGFINADGALSTKSKLIIVVQPGIYPIFANKE